MTVRLHAWTRNDELGVKHMQPPRISLPTKSYAPGYLLARYLYTRSWKIRAERCSLRVPPRATRLTVADNSKLMARFRPLELSR